MVIKRNARKDKLDKVCTALATFAAVNLHGDAETDLQIEIGEIIQRIDAVAAQCIANDNANRAALIAADAVMRAKENAAEVAA